MSEAPREEGLVARVERLALVTLDDAKLREALDTAKYALSVVVHDTETLEQASKMLFGLLDGEKLLAKKKQPYSATLKAANDKLKEMFSPLEAELANAKKYLSDQVLKHNLKRDAEAKAAAAKAEQDRLERERQEREAEAKRKADAAAAEAAGRPAPPPPPRRPPAPVEYVPPAVMQTRTEAGTTSLKWILKCEMVSPHEVPEDWLKLDSSQARAWGQAHAQEEGLKKEKGHSIVHRGVRYWYEPDTHKSSR